MLGKVKTKLFQTRIVSFFSFIFRYYFFHPSLETFSKPHIRKCRWILFNIPQQMVEKKRTLPHKAIKPYKEVFLNKAFNRN